MRARVVDASALAALLFGEPRGPEVSRRLGHGHLVAPSLLRYELASVSVKKLRTHPEAQGELHEALGLFASLPIDLVEVAPEDAVAIALRAGITAYDASYVWVARLLDAELVTLDRHLERRAAAFGIPVV